MPDKENPIAPLSVLMGRATNEFGQEGLIIRTFAILPNPDPDGTHVVQIMCVRDDDWKRDVETPDPEFERVIAEAEKAEAEQRAEQAREGLAKLRDELKDPGKGIGLDG